MDNIIQFFLSFAQYAKDADIFWVVLAPIFTLAAIGIISFVVLKLFSRSEHLRTVFMIHQALIISSLLVAMILVALICYYWSKNLFAESRLELAFIISLILAFAVSIVSFAVLRSYWEKKRVNEIVSQAISAEQARNNIPYINKAFNKIKIWYFLPFVGFLFLLFSLSNGKNLISLVFDNSGSMETTNSYKALDETFGKLDDNNEIIITTLYGLSANTAPQNSMKDIMSVRSSSKLKAGRSYAYDQPSAAKLELNTLLMPNDTVYGSPICESIWKMWLFTKEGKGNVSYKNKLLIVITDGDDNCVKNFNQFFYEDSEFAEYYTPENTHIVDYSTDGNKVVIKKFEENGATVYPAVTSVDDYLSALDNALLSFQNNLNLILWTIVICVLSSIIGLVINPKKTSI